MRATTTYECKLWRQNIVKSHKINSRINALQVLVIPPDGDGKPILMSATKARKMAEEANLDLVAVAPGSDPPVCKIMDYGKFRYERSKKDKEARRRNTASTQVREVRMTPVISNNDLSSKVRLIRKFLDSNGSKVKVTVFLRGRMMIRPEMAKVVLTRVWEEIKDLAQIDSQPNREGRLISMVVSPTAEVKLKLSKAQNAKKGGQATAERT